MMNIKKSFKPYLMRKKIVLKNIQKNANYYLKKQKAEKMKMMKILKYMKKKNKMKMKMKLKIMMK